VLNIPRLHTRAAVIQMQALSFSRGGQLPFEIFDAVAMSEDEAEKRQTDVNVQRLIDETLRDARG
jgi:GR25 family glycosyltransferase involved in LPS biosynthesis